MHIKPSISCVLALSLVLAACGDDDDDAPKPVDVVVMTRNLYLGADLGPAMNPENTVPMLFEAAGGILRQVMANDYETRVQGLAAEILEVEPDLVGLQEVALWRTAGPSLAPLAGGPAAEDVRVDYLALLLETLNADGEKYEAVVVQEEFDFEIPANENGEPGDGGPTPLQDTELNGRLTMRDVILARVDADVEVSNERGAHFENLLALTLAGGAQLEVQRGWTAVDARVRGSRKFRFVNTHLEAFTPTVRAQQAAELVAAGGPATGDLPVVLLGDLNSDDDTVDEIDRPAYQTLLDAGFVERSTDDPMSCCVASPDLTLGDVSDFDHHIDHIMTDAPDDVVLVDSGVTGREMVSGFWNSDHAGVWSVLTIR